MILCERARGIHPRLQYTQETMAAFRKRMETSDTLQQEITRLRRRADDLLTKDLFTEEYANAAFTQHGNYFTIGRQLTDFAHAFSFLYQLGDTSYVPKMKEALLHYASFAAWTGPANKTRKVPWHSDLCTTQILCAYAVAYDAMYDAFTEEERKTIREAMLRLGIHPLLGDWMYAGQRVHALDSMGHNWWSVCTALAGLSLCAIYDEVDGSLSVMEQILASLRMFCSYEKEPLLNKTSNFDDRGMFYESCSYFNYGIGELCRFLHTYRLCFEDDGDSVFPVLDLVPEAYLSMVYPVSENHSNFYVNFGDSPLQGGGLTMLPQYLLLLGYGGDNLLRYYCREKKTPDLMDHLYPDRLIGKDDVAPAYPKTALYPDSGLVFLRTDDSEDATMLSVRCGFTWNHAHDDAGTFIFFDRGENILCDSGTVNYGKQDYVTHYCAAQAHNVVTVNGQGQYPETFYRGTKFPGSISHFIEKGTLAYFLADATGPTCHLCLRNHRSFLRLADDLYVIVDELNTYAPSSFAWLLHYNGTLTEEDARMTVTGKRSRAVITTVSPCPFHREKRIHEDSESIAVVPDEQSRLCNLMHVISFGDSEPAVTPAEGSDWYGCEIRHRGNIYRLAYNFEADGRRMHENSGNTLFGWQTDAYILCDVNDGSQVMLIYGSYLRKGDASTFESLKKEFRILSAAEN